METVAEKPSFREPFKRRRCLVFTNGWYEWKVVGGTRSNPIKQKYMMHRPDNKPFGLAGLRDWWEGNGEVVESCTVIVRDPAPSLAEFHDRMPIILPHELHERWLDPEFSGKGTLLGMLEQFDVENIIGTTIGEPKPMRASKPRKKKE